jgi:hypothetical protein
MSYPPSPRHQRAAGPVSSPYTDPQQVMRLPANDPSLHPDRYANDLFWIMFDDRAGRLICEQHVAGLGLAAAMLVEVAVGGWVTVERSFVWIARDWVPPRDVATHVLVEQISTEPEALPIREWLDYLSQRAFDEVVDRLVRARTLIKEERRRLLRPSVAYTAVNRNDAAWPRARLSTSISGDRGVGSFDTVLLALCDATGLLDAVLESVPARKRTAVASDAHAYLSHAHPATAAIVRTLKDVVTDSAAALA